MITKTIKPNVASYWRMSWLYYSMIEKKLKEKQNRKGPVVTYAPQYKTT
jgi:hypothetical protein